MSKDLVDKRKTDLITQDNDLISASYYLTLNEKRVLMLAIQKINPLSKAWLHNGEVTIDALELVNTFNIDAKNAYLILKESMDRLYNRTIIINSSHDGLEGEEIRWLSRQKYSSKKGIVTFNFSREVAVYLSGMVDYFTSYKLSEVSDFKSIHSIRIYELCIQFRKTGKRIIKLDHLKQALGLSNEYSDWRNFKKWVLDKTIAEINQKSLLAITYKTIKKGRSIDSVVFTFKKSDQYEFDL